MLNKNALAGNNALRKLDEVAISTLLSRKKLYDKTTLRMIVCYERDPIVHQALQDMHTHDEIDEYMLDCLLVAISRARALSQTVPSSSIYKLDVSGTGEGRQLVRSGILGHKELYGVLCFLCSLSQDNPKNMDLEGHVIVSELDGEMLEASPRQWMEKRIGELSQRENLSGGGDVEATWT